MLWLEKARRPGDDIHYRIFNTDGSEAEQCGNGARCIAHLVAGSSQREVRLGHGTGSVTARVLPDGNVSVGMAVPEFSPAKVPFVADEAADRYTLTAGGESTSRYVMWRRTRSRSASVTTLPSRSHGPWPGASTMVLLPHQPTPARTAAALSTSRLSSARIAAR